MSISDHTINAQYEYRIANIVRKLIGDFEDDYFPVTGEELEDWLNSNAKFFSDAVLDDINTWMGFDELLKQVKGE